MRQVLQVVDLEAFRTFLQLVAGRTATELHLSNLGGDAGITHPTVRAWLSVLEASFLVSRLPAWHRSTRKRAVKASKLHFLDTGLACHLLGIASPGQLQSHPLRGALFESWVVSEVLKARLHRGRPAQLFHLRLNRGSEIDLLVESQDRLLAADVKSGATVAGDFFDHLDRLAAEVEESLPHLTYEPRLVYGGEAAQRRTRGQVIPWREVQEVGW